MHKHHVVNVGKSCLEHSSNPDSCIDIWQAVSQYSEKIGLQLHVGKRTPLHFKLLPISVGASAMRTVTVYDHSIA